MPTEDIARRVTRPWTYRLEYWLCNGVHYDSGHVVYQYSSNIDTWHKNRTWVRTPNFRTLVANKQPLPENSYSYTLRRQDDLEFEAQWSVGPGYCVDTSATNKLTVYTYRYPTAQFGPVLGSQTFSDASLRSRLISNAKGAEWSVPTFIGEGRETIGMIAQTARTLASAYRDLRRGNLIGALSSLSVQGTASQRRRYYREYGVDPRRAAANHWLALTYGWRPLVQDVYNAAETLAEHATQVPKTYLETSATSRLETLEASYTKLMGASPHITCDEFRKIIQTYRGVWRFKPTNLDAWGSFGLLNPASVAWELLPFSFVVDWFLPVGRYLEGLDVPMRFDHLGGSIGYRRHVHCDRTNWRFESHSHEGFQSADFYEISRTPLTSSPEPTLSSVVYEPKLGASRVTSAIALMTQVFGR